jgi:pyruvate dehydrogenase E2 component (dihydrolipoamide acetyltransferase)
MATEVVLPNLGLTTEKGSILRWLKKEGDRVEKGESLFEVEADKVTTEVEAPASGILGKILVGENVEVPVSTVVGVIVAENETVPEIYLKKVVETTSTRGEPGEETTTVSPPETVPPGRSGVAQAVPSARKLALEHGVDLSSLVGSGPGGTILKRDVKDRVSRSVSRGVQQVRATPLSRKLAERSGVSLGGIRGSGLRGKVLKKDVGEVLQEPGQEAPSRESLFGRTIPMTQIRKVIARRMSESAFGAPHIYFFAEVEMDRLLELREEIVPDFETRFGVRLSINDFILKAVGLTIRDYPMLNARVEGETIVINPEIHVGLAVAMGEGLIVPAIPNTDRTGLGAIAQQRKDLVARARAGKLNLEEIERGTFTVSSLAQYDIMFFTAILNPPQSGILSVGKLDERVYLRQGEIRTKRVSHMGLSVDHRIIDGAVAAAFLQGVKVKLENPSFAFLHL